MTTPNGSQTDRSRSSGWRIRLRQAIDSCFGEEDLQALCFDLGFDYESLPAAGKTAKIVQLITSFHRQGRIVELIDYCSQQRPNIPWAELREAAETDPSAVISEPDAVAASRTPGSLDYPPSRSARKRLSTMSGLWYIVVAVGFIGVVAAILIIGPEILTAIKPTNTPASATATAAPAPTTPLPSPTATLQQETFHDPTIDGYRLDWCYSYAQLCGMRAATEWCKIRGSAGAIAFQDDPDVGKQGIQTQMIGTGEICARDGCDSFKSITCVKAVGIPRQETFEDPSLDGYRLDWCYIPGQCGIRAATEWCKTQGFVGAIDFQDEPNVGERGIRTKALGTGETCAGDWCDSFTSITCVK